MGLDITFYEATERVGPHQMTWRADDEDYEHYCIDELDHRRVYLWRLHDDPDTFAVTQREFDSEFCYTSTGRTARWRASYGGYSIFRACLFHLVRPDLVLNRADADHSYYPEVYKMDDDEFYALPFAELINFADNGGTYGPEVAGKLLGDFRRFADRDDFAAIFPAWTDDLRLKYREYMDGLTVVGPSGLVDYH